LTNISEVRAASITIALMMEAARASEMSVDNYFTWQYIPEDKSELHTHCRENMKSHIVNAVIITVYSENHTKPTNTKHNVTDC
jgi:hypothetical protein